MPGSASQSVFPTRQYPYHAAAPGAALSSEPDPLLGMSAGAVVRFFLGRDLAPEVLDPSTLALLINDPFAQLILSAGHRPTSLTDLLGILDSATGPQALPVQCVYRIADGGQIPWNVATAGVDRKLRLVVTRQRGDEAELFIATAPPFTSPSIFLQVFAWDPQSGAYNFYERRRGVWSWAGSSWEALEPDTRGVGPFDSHVNGGPVMKELKLPWMHWHSQSAQIRDDILAPADPLRTDPLYQSPDLKGGEDLERIVRAGVARWTTSRFDHRSSQGVLDRATEFLRQLLLSTTVNLTSSPEQSASLQPDDLLRLPVSFFLNVDYLVGELMLPVSLSRPKVAAAHYLDCLQRYGVRVTDGDFVAVGDTHFAFAVPEPSFEDEMVLRELLARRAISRRLALAMLLVDFANPVFSQRRASLLGYLPDRVALDGGADLESSLVTALRASPNAASPQSAEAELLRLLNLPAATWEADMAEQVQTYWTKVELAVATEQGVDAYFRLAESRRREFRKRPLAEFGLTLAVATTLDLPVPLEMTAAATVVERPL